MYKVSNDSIKENSMFKSLFAFIFAFFFSSNAQAIVQARWLSVAAVIIEDGESKIMFDPDWTRPNFFQILGVSRLVSNEELVKTELGKLGLRKVDGIFTSHSHFDHAIDAPIVARLTDAVNYVDESSIKISNAYKDPRIKTISIPQDGVIQIGKFKITAIKRSHFKIRAIGFKFLPGPVPDDFDFNFWQYNEGQAWMYVIEHPEKTILLDQGSESHVSLLPKTLTRVDALLQGVSNRGTDKRFVSGYTKQLRPSLFIPLHYDNFFKDFDPVDKSELPGVRLNDILDLVKKTVPDIKVIRPEYGKVIDL